MQMDVDKTLHLFYSTTKMACVTATVKNTQIHFVGSNSQVYYDNLHNTIVYLQIFKAGHIFSKKRCHGISRNHKL